jgi:hypothetical protein
MRRHRWRCLAETTLRTCEDKGCRALFEWDRLEHVSVQESRRWATSELAPTPAEPREMPRPTRSKVIAVTYKVAESLA